MRKNKMSIGEHFSNSCDEAKASTNKSRAEMTMKLVLSLICDSKTEMLQIKH